MQGLPRINMVSLELKESHDVPDLSVLSNYIESHYREQSCNYKDAFKEFLDLRKSCLSGPESLSTMLSMKRYFCQLQLLKARFPLNVVEDSTATNVIWTWDDPISGSPISFNDIRFEEASVLFNIGCLHCNLGSKETRIELDSTKVACTHFQCSAWAFQFILEKYTPLPSSDLEFDLLRFLNLLMLAQAHECVLEKSMVDQRRAGLTAKIAFQISDFYKQCQGLLQSENIGYSVNSGQYKTWKRLCNLKEHLYYCLTYYYMALSAEEANRYGEIVAWLKLAKDRLEKCNKPLKELKSLVVEETMKFIFDVVNGKFESSKKDNDFIYHDKIPEPDMLPTIKGAMLLKGIAFDVNDPDVCGQDIFKNLVPMETHFSSSIYSEKKATISREIQKEVDDKNNELKTFLSNVQWTDENLQVTDTNIPQELYNCAAFLSANSDVLATIKNTMQDISSISIEVEESFEILSEKMRSATIDKNLDTWKKFETQYLELLNSFEDAKDSNLQLREAFSMTFNNLKFIDQHSSIDLFVDSLPSARRQLSDDADTKSALLESRRLLDKVEEMSNQRHSLCQQLKSELMNDDLTQKLLGVRDESEQNRLIEQELKKHDKTLEYLRQNMAAQSRIMDAIIEHNATIADCKAKIILIREEREKIIAGVITAFNKYPNLLKKGVEGIDFYRKLGTRILNLQKSIEKLLPNRDLKPDKKPAKVMTTITKFGEHSNDLSDGIAAGVASININFDAKIPQIPPDVSLQHQQMIAADLPVPKLKDYRKLVNKRSSTIADTSPEPTNVAADAQASMKFQSQYQYNQWGFYGPPSNQTIYQPYYSISKSRGPYDDFITTQNFQFPVPCSEVGSGNVNYMNYSSLPRTNHSHYTNSTNSVNSSMGSVGNLNTTGVTINSFTIPYQQHPYYSNNILSMAYSCNRPSLQVSQSKYNSEIQPQESCFSSLSTKDTAGYYHQPVINHPVVQPTILNSNQYPDNLAKSVQQPQSNLGGFHIYNNSSSSYFGSTDLPKQNMLDHFPPINASKVPPQPLSDSTSNNYYESSPYQQSNQFSNVNCSMPMSFPYSNFPDNQVWSANHPTLTQFPDYHSSVQQNNQFLTLSEQSLSNYETNSPSHYIQQTVATISTYNNSVETTKTIMPTHVSISTFQGRQSFPEANTSVSTIESVPNNFLSQSQSISASDGKANPTNIIVTNAKLKLDVGFNKSKPTDLLSSSPTNYFKQENASAVLEPKVLTKEEIEDQKEEKRKQIYRKQNSSGIHHPLNDNLVLNKFISDSQRFMKKSNELLDNKLLDEHWNQLLSKERLLPKKSTAVAKCSPLKNRMQESVPYDENRIILKDVKDDYVNASHIVLQSIDECLPRFIACQTPLPNTMIEFWTAIFEQGCEILVQLAATCNKDDTSKARPVMYWPESKTNTLNIGSKYEVTVQSFKEKPNWHERILLVKHLKSKQSKSVWHFQVNNVGNKLPKSNEEFLAFTTDLCSYYRQQRSMTKPIAISCLNGSSVCGLLILLTAALTQMEIVGVFPDIDNILMKMWSQRRNLLDDKHQLAFIYKTISKAASDMLSKRNIVIGPGRVLASSHGSVSSEHSHSPVPTASSNTTVASTTVNSSVSATGAASTLGNSTTSLSILDSIFSSQHLLISDLNSAISKWTVKLDDDKQSISSSENATTVGCTSVFDDSINLDDSNKNNMLSSTDVCGASKIGEVKSKDIQLPSNLKHLEDPAIIDLTPTPSDRRRITKKEFQEKMNKSSHLSSVPIDATNSIDPFKDLDLFLKSATLEASD